MSKSERFRLHRSTYIFPMRFCDRIASSITTKWGQYQTCSTFKTIPISNDQFLFALIDNESALWYDIVISNVNASFFSNDIHSRSNHRILSDQNLCVRRGSRSEMFRPNSRIVSSYVYIAVYFVDFIYRFATSALSWWCAWSRLPWSRLPWSRLPWSRLSPLTVTSRTRARARWPSWARWRPTCGCFRRHVLSANSLQFWFCVEIVHWTWQQQQHSLEDPFYSTHLLSNMSPKVP